MNESVKKEKSKFLNNRSLIIILAVAVVISITASAMTVDKFTDYEPPSTLVIRWGDYIDSVSGEIRTDNSVTSSPTWRAEYPYRALFLGRQYGSASSSKLNTQSIYIIYSKKPVTDLFTFKYHGNRTYPRTGFIRAQFNKRAFLENDDIKILHHTYDISSNEPISPYLYTNIETNNTWILSHTDDSGPLYELYFDFDFYYDCTDRHQQNTQLLNVSGLRNITDVPYAYILTCDGHGSGGGSTSGSSSGSGGSSGSSGSSGGSSSGGSGSSSSSSKPWYEDDTKTPDLSGGSSGSSGSSSSVSASEGTTGEKGDTWTLPEYITQGLPWSTDDLNIPSMPELKLPEFPEPSFNFPAFPDMPEVELPPVPYEPGDSTWPPPFPGTE